LTSGQKTGVLTFCCEKRKELMVGQLFWK